MSRSDIPFKVLAEVIVDASLPHAKASADFRSGLDVFLCADSFRWRQGALLRVTGRAPALGFWDVIGKVARKVKPNQLTWVGGDGFFSNPGHPWDASSAWPEGFGGQVDLKTARSMT